MSERNDRVRILVGPPGCGKTRYIADRTRKLLAAGAGFDDTFYPFIICSLTRAAAAEAAGRIQAVPKGAVGTLHSHCFRALGHPPLVVGPEATARWNEAYPRYRLSLMHGCGTRFDDVGDTVRFGGTHGDRLLAELDRLRHRMIPAARWPAPVRAFAERWSAWKDDAGYFDFTDLIERAEAHPQRPGRIYVDEAQDISRLELECLLRFREAADAELILVGDEHQSIYEWRGASPTLFTDLKLPPDRRAVLSRSYRIPAAVHRMADRWIRRLSTGGEVEYHPRRINPSDPSAEVAPGAVVRCGATWKWPELAVREAVELSNSGQSVLLIGSTNRFVGPTCAVLRRMRIPFSNPWRRKERAWNPLYLGDESSITHPLVALIAPALEREAGGRWWGYDSVASWIAPLRSKGVLRRGARKRIKEAASALENRPVEHAHLEEWFEPDVLDALIGMLEREVTPAGLARLWLGWVRPQRKRAAEYAVGVLERHGLDILKGFPTIHPSTAHGAKGGEADHVFIFPDLSPAGMRSWTGRPAERDSVIRLCYVALTRARECVHLCEPASRYFVGLPR